MPIPTATGTRANPTRPTPTERGNRAEVMSVAQPCGRAALIVRLRRLEGQIRGVARMIDAEEPCLDILTQIKAAERALQSVALLLVEEHLREKLAQIDDDGGSYDQKALEDDATNLVRLVAPGRGEQT